LGNSVKFQAGFDTDRLQGSKRQLHLAGASGALR
jgi:hypothetical protein